MYFLNAKQQPRGGWFSVRQCLVVVNADLGRSEEIEKKRIFMDSLLQSTDSGDEKIVSLADVPLVFVQHIQKEFRR